MTTKKTTFKKSFYLRERKIKNGFRYTIEAKITINGESVHFNTGIEVDKKKWVKSMGRLIGKSTEERTINANLDSIIDEIECYHTAILHRQGYVTPTDIKAAIMAKREKRQKENSEENQEKLNKKDFFDYFEEFNELKKMEVSKKTYSRYVTTKNRFSAYFKKITKKKPEQIEFSDLTPTLINGFYGELRKKYNIENNMAMKYMQKLRSVTNYIMDEDEQSFKNPFRMFKFHFEETDRPFLTIEQINAIMEYNFNRKSLERIRDMFLFSCFTGLSFGEMRRLKKEDITKSHDGSLWIIDRRKKTKTQYKVRLMKVPKLILEKYKGKTRNGTLLPMIANRGMNEGLHCIGELCEIGEDLTFHVGRHSFATLCLTEDVPIETLSKMLGHKSIRTTQIYARVIDKKLSKDMDAMEQKINAKSSEYTNFL